MRARRGKGCGAPLKLLFGDVAPSGGPEGILGKAPFLLPSIAWLGWLGGLAGWVGWLAWPVGLARWLSELGCRAGLSCWAVRLGCPSPCMAVWLAGWPRRLAGLPGLACPPAPPPLQTPQPAQPAYRNWVADLTGRRRRQRPKRQRPRPTTAGCGVPQPAPATGAVCDPIPSLPVAPVVSFRRTYQLFPFL